ncbi:hydrogenase nickel incorporation protein HypB [Rhodococcoides yunnanense]|uniref:hydrogenase nickel incorporation protein HypB n=1 Tax=Rhodococcoides yunnanense TaxID=278209 RepID=UPI0009354875|nr:hydrogenase nickel incorporation protein HypB [Rhodococcus yunnanensis]
MCATCGCQGDGGPVVTLPHEHQHPHSSHEHDHDHDHQHGPSGEVITLEQKVLAKNDLLAERNRGWLAGRAISAFNVMSSPGAGKTTLLVRTIGDLSGARPIAVIEGDQETTLDADRIEAAGSSVVQINTGSGCHLDADMVRRALEKLDPATGTLLFIENVGNLVCPALFDLGEEGKLVLISVTEGDDKPLKYPHMFAVADAVVVNKTDLLPYVDFDMKTFVRHAQSVNPEVRILPTSATTGDGMDDWYGWLAENRHIVR